jgi:hydrogenase maturation protease
VNPTPFCVIGLGNVFLGDDGFGPLFVEVFQCEYEYGANVEVLDLGTPGLDLGPYLYGRELVVIVDAVHADVPPGTLSILREEDFVSRSAKLRITGHGPGLWQSLAHLRLAGGAPRELIILGVNPGSIGFAEATNDAMRDGASETGAVLARILAARGIECRRRRIDVQPNLWWI